MIDHCHACHSTEITEPVYGEGLLRSPSGASTVLTFEQIECHDCGARTMQRTNAPHAAVDPLRAETTP